LKIHPAESLSPLPTILSPNALLTQAFVCTDYPLLNQYIPNPPDLIIATIHHSSTDQYSCSITPHTPQAILPHLAFESATKKTRPQLSSGSLVYARITAASKYTETELTCVNLSTGKSDGMGPLTGGCVFDVSGGMARRLLMPRREGKVVVLEEMGEKVPFEVAVGRNGQVWVKSETVTGTVAVGRALKETDEKGLRIDEQKALVKKLSRGL